MERRRCYWLWLISFEVLYLVSSMAMDPCKFPIPGDDDNIDKFASECSTSVVSVPYICDSAAMLSSSEATQIDQLRQHYQLSHCIHKMPGDQPGSKTDQSSMSKSPTIGIGIIANQSLALTDRATKNTGAFIRKRLRCTDLQFEEQPKFRNLGDFYASVIRKRWERLKCQTDIYLLLIVSFNQHHTQLHTKLHLDFSPLFPDHLQAEFHSRLKSIEANSSSYSSSVSQKLLYFIGSWSDVLPLKSSIKKLDIMGMPQWALISLVCLIVVSLVLSFIGIILNRYAAKGLWRRTGSGPRNASARKWGAGFAGGLWNG